MATDDGGAIECSVGDETLVLLREGPSRTSEIYRDRDRGCFVRLIPLAEASAAAKAAVRGAAREGSPAPDVSAIRRDFTVSAGVGYYAIEYASPHSARTLSRTLNADPIVTRLNRLADVAERLSEWRRSLQAPALLSPYDVVVDGADKPSLLPLPVAAFPDFAGLCAEPERALYLAPEYLRGAPGPADVEVSEALDRYAWGACLFQALFELAVPERPEELLLDAGCGALTDPGRGVSRLSDALKRLPAAVSLHEIVAETCAASPSRRLHRSDADLARTVRDCADSLDPVRVFRETAKTLPPLDALFALQNLLTEHESRELLLMGAALAERVFLPLDAVDYYERAMKSAPDDPQAYGAVFRLISEARNPGHPLQDVYRRSLELGAQLDRRLAECFRALARLNPAGSRQTELKLAKHYLWRAEQLPVFYQNAANFIRSRIVDREDKPLFYKAELNVGYCEALFGQKRLVESKSYLELVSAALADYRSKNRIDPAELDRADRWIRDLRRRIAEAEGRRAS